MIKQYFLNFLIFLSFFAYSQQNSQENFYEIEYSKTINFDNLSQPLNSNYTLNLFTDLNKSIFFKSVQSKESPEIEENKGKDGSVNLTYTPKGKNMGVLYKDYKAQELFFKYYSRLVVVDSLNIFNWEIKEDTKELLGFSCKKATINFRGRTYIAWFTNDLPVGGPWKYDGLPGMILEIKSTDNFMEFKALSVNNASKQRNLENPFIDNSNKYMSWQEYKDFYRKRAIKALSDRSTEFSRGTEYSRGGIEIYIDYDDEEYNKIIEDYRKNNN